MAATTVEMSTALTGTLRALSFAHCEAPGTAPSREKANSIRLVEVMQAVVQKNWPMLAMSSTRKAQSEVSAWLKMTATPPPPAVTPSGSCTAKRKASRRIQPPMAE